MNLYGDWKWYGALAVFILSTAFVVWGPVPNSKCSSTHISPSVIEEISNTENTNIVPVESNDDDIPYDNDNLLPYIVQEGDTVEFISSLFVISEEDLRRLNHIPDSEDLTPGRTIYIPPESP